MSEFAPTNFYAAAAAGTGTLTSTGTGVEGAGGSAFDTELAVGDYIISDGQRRIIATISDADTLTTTVAFSPALSADTFTYMTKRVEIQDDGDVVVGGDLTISGDATFTGDATVVGSFFPKQVTDAGPMTATNGTIGEIVFNTSDSKFYGCTVTGTPATWAAFH